jgi:hypothetical protein
MPLRNERMCNFGSCREMFDYRWCGLGAKKYCDKHMAIARKGREAKWYQDNKELQKARALQWKKDNPEKHKAHIKKYQSLNKEKMKAYGKKYREEHKHELFMKRQAKRMNLDL